MLRRHAIALLLSSPARWFDGEQGTALVLDVRTRRCVAVQNAPVAARELAPPGSVIKPFVLAALLRAHKLRPTESFPCPGALTIGGRSLACSHPPVATPIEPRTALAYSCNCFAAHFAQRFQPGELAAYLQRAGLVSLTGLFDQEAAGRILRADTSEANQLQALGEDRVRITAAALAVAYRRLAANCEEPILGGLEDAVEFGTAQHARIAGLKIAGKTGSARQIAWFAGFAPSRAPEVVVVVMLHARSGGADAAPVAARLFRAWRTGRL